mgnify:CR=1 FL=1
MRVTSGGSCGAFVFFFQAEDGIRDLVRSRGLGDVYKRQALEAADIDEAIRILEQRREVGAAFTHPVLHIALGLSLIHI